MDTRIEKEQNCQALGQVSDEIIDPLRDGISSVELVRVSGSDLDVANAARVSYGKISTQLSDKDRSLINFLMEHEHTSPFEHNQLSFRVKMPIFVARQWMRHRMHSYNEVSYRYTKVKTEFFVPQEWRFQDTVNHQSSVGAFENEELTQRYEVSIKVAWDTYNALLDAGVCRELARAVLPVATYTEIIFTTNLHALMHFMRLRLSSGAQREIRAYARAMFKLAFKHFPASLIAWQKKYVHNMDKELEDELNAWMAMLGDK